MRPPTGGKRLGDVRYTCPRLSVFCHDERIDDERKQCGSRTLTARSFPVFEHSGNVGRLDNLRIARTKHRGPHPTRLLTPKAVTVSAAPPGLANAGDAQRRNAWSVRRCACAVSLHSLLIYYQAVKTSSQSAARKGEVERSGMIRRQPFVTRCSGSQTSISRHCNKCR
jgi:hypothetical protein